MTKEKAKEFQVRIAGANRRELLIINYEMILTQLDEAIEALNQGDDEHFGQTMIGAHKMLRELSSNLDFNYDVSKELMSIYIYVNKKLIDASINMEKEDVLEAKKILDILLKGWQLAEVDGDHAPLVENSQKVYAGLTYGKNNLNESYDFQARSRGFKA